MLRHHITSALALASLVGLTACSDPIIGDWKSDDSCGKQKLTVEDDGKGDGHVYMVNAYGDCVKCTFDFEWEEDGDDYKADVEFDECHCDGVKKGDAKCDMNDDGDKMDCSLQLGTCDLGEEEWEKDE